jgi:zinc D-Ala-D-Ala carboxypeptidase
MQRRSYTHAVFRSPIGRSRTLLTLGVVLAALSLVGCALAPFGNPWAEPATTPVATASRPPPTATPAPTAAPASPTPDPEPSPTFDRTAQSLDDSTSLWVVVNKQRPLRPTDYLPSDLRRVDVPFVFTPQLRAEAADAVEKLVAAASADGVALQSQSAFRSFDTQRRVYAGSVAQLGQEAADLTSARPGHSEHQTGLAIDFSAVPAKCTLKQCFAQTPQGQWLAANAWRFGFHLRYPDGSTPITGYEFEPWHYRYVGVELATELQETGIRTLEEFFGLPAAATYAD